VFPLVLVGVALLAVVLRKRGAAQNGDAASPQSSSTAEAVTDWDDEWGAPNSWDAKYPTADPKKPIPYVADDLDPTFKGRIDQVFSAMKARGYDPKVYEGGRSQRRQAYLYGQGRTDFAGYGREGSKVTWTLSSNHGAYPARAVDVISTAKGWSDQAFFTALGEEVAKVGGMTWGGSWSSKDYPHVELA
jgi:hypothetical protein